MKLRTRKKHWRKHWFFLRLYCLDFHSFSMSDVRHALNCQIIYDPLIGFRYIR